MVVFAHTKPKTSRKTGKCWSISSKLMMVHQPFASIISCGWFQFMMVHQILKFFFNFFMIRLHYRRFPRVSPVSIHSHGPVCELLARNPIGLFRFLISTHPKKSKKLKEIGVLIQKNITCLTLLNIYLKTRYLWNHPAFFFWVTILISKMIIFQGAEAKNLHHQSPPRRHQPRYGLV